MRHQILIAAVCAVMFAAGAGCATGGGQARASSAAAEPKPARLTGIAVPAHVQALLDEVEAVYASGDYEALRVLLASDFLYQGMDADAFVQHLRELHRFAGPVTISVLRFAPAGDMAELVGYAEYAGGVIAPSLQALPLNVGSKLVREDGRWKLAGNGQQRELPLYRRAVSMVAEYRPADLALYRSLLPEGAAMPDAPRVRIQFTDWQTMESPQVPYQLAAVQIRAVQDEREGWHLLAMPETDWLSVKAGQPLGFPKFVEAFSHSRDDKGWRAVVGPQATPVIEISFAADPAAEAAYRPLDGAPFWLSTPSGEPRRTAQVVALVAMTDASNRFGWMTVNLGGAEPWAGLVEDGARAAAVEQSIAGGFKLTLGRLETPTVARVPADVQKAVDGYEKAILSNDIDDVMSFFSERYRSGGRDFAAQRAYISSWMPAMTRFEITITRFDPVDENRARFVAVARHSYGEREFRGEMVREAGAWKWIGDGKQ